MACAPARNSRNPRANGDGQRQANGRPHRIAPAHPVPKTKGGGDAKGARRPLVVSAAKWRAVSVPPCAKNQALAERALVMVSMVVKVLLAIRNSVLRGLSSPQHTRQFMPVDIGDKVKALARDRDASSASTAICGPRSEPPMPMLTTSVMAASSRTACA
jgi:hypothetical protein